MDEETRQRFERIESILAQTAEQQAQNTVAITQLTYGIEQLRQSLIEERRLISDVRGELAQHTNDPNAHPRRKCLGLPQEPFFTTGTSR